MANLFRSLTFYMWASWFPSVQAGALRGQQDQSDTLEDLRRALMGYSPDVEARLAELSVSMDPIFQALPRSAEGYLEASAVRYLLHRYFVSHHGWFVPVSGSRSEVANESLPQVIIGRSALASTLSEHLAARGLSLREVAVLAMALESQANRETIDRLHAAYRILRKTHLESHAKESELLNVHKVYLALYVNGLDHSTMTRTEMNDILDDIYTPVPMWDELLVWAREVRSEVLAKDPEIRSSFAGQLRFFEELQHRYAGWQDQQCLSVKSALMQHAMPGTGRVPLPAFRAASLPGGWHTDDLEENLREVGALDETDPSQPSVVVPNYFDSTQNCEDPSKYYSVCCISECEALLGYLERQLGSPYAPPQRIVEIVEKLPSSTVEAPRTLPPQLVRRLDGVAAIHGGHAPLHGRLFRQWMHHAYPAECSFPHVVGVAKDLSQSKEVTEARQMQVENSSMQDMEVSDELPWLDEEELFLCGPSPPKESIGMFSRTVWRGVVLLVIAFCMACRLAQMATPAVLAVGWSPGSTLSRLVRLTKQAPELRLPW